MKANLSEWLDDCRKSFGNPVRKTDLVFQETFCLRPVFYIRMAQWLQQDPLRANRCKQEILWHRGRVVWGYVVLTNVRLFSSANRWSLPALVIHSDDARFDGDIASLEAIADEVIDLRGMIPLEKQWQSLAEFVNNEKSRPFRIAVPSNRCPENTVFLSACLIHPPYLPGGVLGQSLVPLVVCPKETNRIMVLPCSFWPEEMRQWWISD